MEGNIIILILFISIIVADSLLEVVCQDKIHIILNTLASEKKQFLYHIFVL